jgi:hypothetical protein
MWKTNYKISCMCTCQVYLKLCYWEVIPLCTSIRTPDSAHLTCFAAATFVGRLTQPTPPPPQKPEPWDSSRWRCGECVCVCVVCVNVCEAALRKQSSCPAREGAPPLCTPVCVPTILYITWSLNTFATSGAPSVVLPSVGGQGCLGHFVGYIRYLSPSGRCEKASSVCAHPWLCVPPEWLGPPLAGTARALLHESRHQASLHNNGWNPHTLNRLSHNMVPKFLWL